MESASPESDATRRALVEAMHATEWRVVLAVAGGGNAAITDLLDVPGASRTVLEIRVPYARSSLDELVAGQTIDPKVSAVSAPMAEAMAQACLARAAGLAGDDSPERVLGVACTAALATDRQRRGDDRAHIAVAGPAGVTHEYLELSAAGRTEQDRTVADAVLATIATAMGLGHAA